MNTWNTFMGTGRIADYLFYKSEEDRSVEMGREDCANAVYSVDDRSGFGGTGYWGI